MSRFELGCILCRVKRLYFYATKYEILQYKYGGPLYCVEIRYFLDDRRTGWVRHSTHESEGAAIDNALEQLHRIIQS